MVDINQISHLHLPYSNMEVILPSHASDFDLNSARSSPHASAPSTPKLMGEYYFSAPTSPSHLAQFYKDNFDDFLVAGSGGKVPRSSSPRDLIGDDFAFDVSEEWETASQLSAEELFDGGVIRPLKPPPVGIQLPQVATKRSFQGAFSPRGKNNRKGNAVADVNHHRGRSERAAVHASKTSRAARSLSPIRDGECQYWEEEKQQSNNAKSSSSMICSSKGSRKWRLKDFFLFRSASEGRAAEKDHLKNYTAAYRRSSFRAIDSHSPGPRKGAVSAHELHYTVNRAVSQDLKKKTFLPYKQGILGRLAFNPAVHALANGFGFSRK